MPSINTVNTVMSVVLTVVGAVAEGGLAVCSVSTATLFSPLMMVAGTLGAVMSTFKVGHGDFA